MTAALVDRIRALPREQRLALYRALAPGTLASQRCEPAFWARPEQTLPARGQRAHIELATGGRRAGKSTWACWFFLREWQEGRALLPRVVASTEGAIEDVLITGPAGLWTWLPYELRARVGHDVRRAFVRSRGYGGTFTIPGLPEVVCLSAEKAGNAVGQGKDLTWADDPAAWVKVCGARKATDMFYELRVSTSEGPSPCLIVSTTPGGVNFMRRAFSGDMRGVNKRNVGSARDNTAIARGYVEDVLEDMIGDGDDSDLTGAERLETAGALWRWAWIDPYRVDSPPELERVVVAVDPADRGKLDADETGVVVIGLGRDGRLYVLADYTGHWEAEHWAAIAAWACRDYGADAIVAEINRAESLVRRCMSIEAPNLPIIGVSATKGKETRAEPLTLLYRDGQVSHVKGGAQLSRPGPVTIQVPMFDPRTHERPEVELVVKRDRRRWTTLEEELCGWVPKGSRSPNGLDALVWGAWHLRPPDGAGPWEPAAGARALGGLYGSADPRRGAVDPRRLSRVQERRFGR